MNSIFLWYFWRFRNYVHDNMKTHNFFVGLFSSQGSFHYPTKHSYVTSIVWTIKCEHIFRLFFLRIIHRISLVIVFLKSFYLFLARLRRKTMLLKFPGRLSIQRTNYYLLNIYHRTRIHLFAQNLYEVCRILNLADLIFTIGTYFSNIKERYMLRYWVSKTML